MLYTKIGEFLETIPQALPDTKPDNYKNDTKIKALGGALFLEKRKEKYPTIRL